MNTRSGVWIKTDVSLRDSIATICQLGSNNDRAGVRGAALAVFLAIGLHVNKGGLSWPGIACLSRETGYSARQVRRALDLLESAGYITQESRFYKKRGMENGYHVNAYRCAGFFAYGANSEDQEGESEDL